jgi:hypothetical protein
LKVEGSEEVACWVRKWKGARPSNKLGWVRCLDWRDKLNGTELHDVVDRVDREAIPLGPPAAPRVTQRFVGRVLEEELNVVDAGSLGVDAVGVGGCQGRIDANKIPTRSSGAFG